MRILIVSDAGTPQVNGVVTTYEQTSAQLTALGHEVEILTPAKFPTFPCPTYPSIRLAWRPGRGVAATLSRFDPDAVHIATEGPLGHAARRICLKSGRPFTTAFHTQFPEYIKARVPIPISWSYRYLRGFHQKAARTMVPTPSQRERLAERGFENLVVWPRGVDTTLFRPRGKHALSLPRPIAMYMGRVAVEKNLEAFLELELPGSKVVIGAGPDLVRLQERHQAVHFVGQKLGDELVELLSAADVFVFPSLTDTFGVVLLEAMACGVPVAAFPVTGPIDVVRPNQTGILDWDLRAAALRALDLDPADCIAQAAETSWRAATETFVSNLAIRSVA